MAEHLRLSLYKQGLNQRYKMSVTKGQLRDFRSSAVNSDGGVISAIQIPATELAIATSAGATSITVHDAGGFAIGNEIVIDDGINKEKRVIVNIVGNVFTLNIGLVSAYVVNTPIATKNALLPDVTAQQANDGITVFRKFFRMNANPTVSWTEVRAWLPNQLTNSAISFGVGLNHADDNDGTQGNMTAFSANSVVAVVSDGVDTRTVTIVGENATGVRQVENLVLNGTTEVVGSLIFARVYFVSVPALDGARTITIRQGAGGTTRGTIGINRIVCFLWFGRRASGGVIIDAEGGNILTDIVGLRLGEVVANGNIPIWVRMSVPTGANAISNNTAHIQIRGETG